MTDPEAESSLEKAARPARGSADAPMFPRPRLVLVLGGGGAKALAHIGVIRAMETLSLEVDEVIGTGTGALIGALFAAGLDAAGMERVAAEAFADAAFRRNVLQVAVKGAREAAQERGRRFLAFLRERLPVAGFAELGRPFFCNALSLSTGRLQYFGPDGGPEVSLAEAVYASCCLPGFFEPIELEGEHYVSGGLAENLALKLAHARRAELVVASDLALRDHHQPSPYTGRMSDVLLQTYEALGGVLNEHNCHRFATDRVVLLRPKVADVGLLDADRVESLVRRGEEEAVFSLSGQRLTRYMCDTEVVKGADRAVAVPRDHVLLDVDQEACIHCGLCAAICATGGYAAVPVGDVVRKLHHYECTRDSACERNCPTKAIRLRNM